MTLQQSYPSCREVLLPRCNRTYCVHIVNAVQVLLYVDTHVWPFPASIASNPERDAKGSGGADEQKNGSGTLKAEIDFGNRIMIAKSE